MMQMYQNDQMRTRYSLGCPSILSKFRRNHDNTSKFSKVIYFHDLAKFREMEYKSSQKRPNRTKAAASAPRFGPEPPECVENPSESVQTGPPLYKLELKSSKSSNWCRILEPNMGQFFKYGNFDPPRAPRSNVA